MNKLLLPILIVLLLTACQTEALTPPRLATQTAAAVIPDDATATLPPPAILPDISEHTQSAITAPLSAVDDVPHITLWVNETSAAHVELLAEIAADFQATHQIHLEVIHVTPTLLPALVQTAVLSQTLPDLILHPLDYTAGWLAQGILDGDAATRVLNQLDAGTFNADSLDLLRVDPRNSTMMALPSDGWSQLLVYRTDWFANANLAPPNSLPNMMTAAEALTDREALVAGIVVPTESSLITTQYVFEQWAIANGCQLIDNKGEVTFVHPACLDALDFYRTLINQYSPSDVQTDTSALNAYQEGRTSMITASPAVLPAIAGLDPNNLPRCPECTTPLTLAQNSGLITQIQGRGDFSTTAQFSHVTALGITSVALPEAQTFAQYWFEMAYPRWLMLEPERKVPLRLYSTDQTVDYLSMWQTAPEMLALTEVYGQELPALLSSNIAGTNRWGFAQGQATLVTTIAEEKVFSILLQEMLSGYLTSSETVLETYKRVVDLIPNYQYYNEIEVTPVSE